MPSIIYKVRDQDKDTQQFSFPANIGTAGTFAAQETAFNAFTTALAGIVLGAIVKTDYSMIGAEVDLTPTNQFAQTNIQWVAVWKDNVTNTEYHTRMGTADLALLTAGTTTLTAGAPFNAFKTAFDAIVRSPIGNAASLIRLEYKE